MGNFFCSPCSECAKGSGSYDKIEDGNFHEDLGGDFIATMSKEFDPNSSTFQGAYLDQKFTSKTTYEPRFVWVNLETLTIHMSQHNTKERRHKEASLADVTNVERGPPKRLKLATDVTNEAACMTVNFQRGGGIDLKFATEAECDLWFKVLSKVVAYMKTK
jgi:hypothetical protein